MHTVSLNRTMCTTVVLGMTPGNFKYHSNLKVVLKEKLFE